MFNIALALAFAVSSLLSPGRKVLYLVMTEPLVQSLPHYQVHLLTVFTNYWIPTVLIYIALRQLRADAWLRPTPTINFLLGLANFLLIFYIASRTFASTIAGGGASFAVISYAPLVLVPAWALLAIGLVKLTIRTIQERKERQLRETKPLRIGGALLLIVLIVAPLTAIVSALYSEEDAPLRIAWKAKQFFDDKCKTAGEKIVSIPQNVESIYLEPNSERYFERIRNGVYGAYGSSRFGETLTHTGKLRYFEEFNDMQNIDGSSEKYRKRDAKNRQGDPVTELTSEYGVFQKPLINTIDEKRLGVSGTEVTVKNLKTNQITATLVFFTSNRHRTICGQSEDGKFSVSQFIQKSLNLTQKF